PRSRWPLCPPLPLLFLRLRFDGHPPRIRPARARRVDGMRELARPRVSRPTRRARRPAHPASVGLGAHHGRAPVSDRLARSFAPRLSARVSAGRLEVGVVVPTYWALAGAENIARAAALSDSL